MSEREIAAKPKIAKVSGGLSLCLTLLFWLQFYRPEYFIGYPYGFGGAALSLLVSMVAGVFAIVVSKQSLWLTLTWLIGVIGTLLTLIFLMSLLH